MGQYGYYGYNKNRKETLEKCHIYRTSKYNLHMNEHTLTQPHIRDLVWILHQIAARTPVLFLISGTSHTERL
jgi:hypothetical protein